MNTTSMQAQPLHKTPEGWTVIVPAGSYFLGDPCYAVPDAFWDALLNTCKFFEKPIGTANGFEVLGFGTAWGDGSYQDQDGNEYPVDAGLIGLVPVGLIEQEQRAELLKLGRMVDFTEPTACTAAQGVMQFGRIRIDTRNFDDTAEEL
jgi:hypothetical protein